MEPWHIWVICALLFFILEIFTAGFAVACFSIGAIAAAIASACEVSLLWQCIIFAVVSIVALVTVRPLVLKIFYKGDEQKTNVDAIIGRKGRVTRKIDAKTGFGRVAIDGDDWKAVSIDGGDIDEGEWVEVVAHESLIITVKKTN